MENSYIPRFILILILFIFGANIVIVDFFLIQNKSLVLNSKVQPEPGAAQINLPNIVNPVIFVLSPVLTLLIKVSLRLLLRKKNRQSPFRLVDQHRFTMIGTPFPGLNLHSTKVTTPEQNPTIFKQILALIRLIGSRTRASTMLHTASGSPEVI